MNKLLSRILMLTFTIAAVGVEDARAVDVDVSVNVKHTVDGISTFDREKFITVHANHYSPDFGDAVTLADFATDRDVYFGRDTGFIGWYTSNQINEDPTMPGWARLSGHTYSTVTQGSNARGSYNSTTWAHPFEFRAQSDIVCAQFSPFWPESGTMRGGWNFSTNDTPSEPFGSATGDHMGNFLNNFFGTAANGYIGRPLPGWVEILNEPDYPLFDNPGDPMYGTSTWAELFDYHNTVANQIRSINSDVKIGGFCPSHPELAQNNFQEWNERFKPFIDTCGTNMDFFSIHIYDVYDNNTVKKGSNLEAQFDMIEHYGHLTLGQPLPFVVSEYGGRDRDLESYPSWRPLLWDPERDWVAIKSFNSMLMSFADRPHLINKAIPFVMLKEEWAAEIPVGPTSTYAHNWRLYRKANEPASYTGAWVYSEYIKFYDLWSDVSGTRVDVITDDPDIQVDAYVDGDKAYVILNNLNTFANLVNLNLFEYYGNTVQGVVEKNLYWDGSNVVLDETNHVGNITQVQVEAEGAVVLEYDFSSPLNVNETSDEVKYYASTYYQFILGGFSSTFHVNDVTNTGTYGDVVMRLGMGRAKTASKVPTVIFNGTPVTVPTDFMGHEGDGRATFFGQLDIPIPHGLLQSNNTISITYPDSGGHISSVSLRTYDFSTDVRNGGPPPVIAGAVFTDTEVAGGNLVLSVSNGIPNGYFDLMASDDLMVPGSNWVASQLGLQFDGAGESMVTNPVSEVQEFFSIREPGTPIIPVTGVSVAPSSSSLGVGDSLLLGATVSPGNANDPSVTWSSDTPGVATVSSNGLVDAISAGSAIITATTTDGGFTDTCAITVSAGTLAMFDWNEAPTGTENSAYGALGFSYTETDNGVTMAHGGRATTGQIWNSPSFTWNHAITFTYDPDDASPALFTMSQGGSGKNFTVQSVDILVQTGTGEATLGDFRLYGTLGGSEVWSIDLNPYVDTGINTLTTGMTGEIDTLAWDTKYGGDGAWGDNTEGYVLDNLTVLISP